MDETLRRIVHLVRNFAEIYAVDMDVISDFTEMYELEDDVNVMFFYQNRHIQVDCGSGVHSRIHFPIHEPQEMVDLIEIVFRGAQKGLAKVESVQQYATRHRF